MKPPWRADDPERGREAEARAEPEPFVVKNGSKNAVEDFGSDAAAGVGDFDLHTWSGLRVREHARVTFVHHEIRRAQAQRAAPGHRVARIHAEIEQHLMSCVRRR